jgi:hypothetical protein
VNEVNHGFEHAVIRFDPEKEEVHLWYPMKTTRANRCPCIIISKAGEIRHAFQGILKYNTTKSGNHEPACVDIFHRLQFTRSWRIDSVMEQQIINGHYPIPEEHPDEITP